MQSDDVGYHVGGFDEKGRPKLYHIFWGVQRPPSTGSQRYEFQDILANVADGFMLYNGRNDLVWNVVQMLIRESGRGEDVPYNLQRHIDLVRFGDFVIRFASEITFEVGPPFLFALISPKNEIRYIKNDNFFPIDGDEIVRSLVGLGYIYEGPIYSKHEIARQRAANVIQNLRPSTGLLVTASIAQSPVELYLAENSIASPDVFWSSGVAGRCVLTDEDKWFGPPDLVVEVLSQKTQLADREYKFDLYEKYGVREYWLVDPDSHFVEVYYQEGGKFMRSGVFAINIEFESRLFDSKIMTNDLLGDD